VLTGEALVTEDKRLIERVNHIVDHVQSSLCRAVRNAIVDGSARADTDAPRHACVLTHLVLGKWLRFAQSGWRLSPTDDIGTQLDWLIQVEPSHAHGRPGTPDPA